MLAILAAALLAASPQHDTVYTADGGRLVGTVVEESPQGISVQLPDGTTRRLPVRDVARIEYADGSISTPNRPAPPPAYRPPPASPGYAPPPTYSPPPPAYAPPPPSYAPPAYRPPPPPSREPAAYAAPGGSRAPLSPFYGVFGLGGAFLSGEVSDGIRMDDVYESQLDVWLEGGLRLDPHLALGLYVDVGVGDPAREIRDLCRTDFAADCTATTGRVGLLLRHTFSPRAASTPWLAIGTGFEFGDVSIDEDHGGTSEELFSYSGWEVLRLMAGVDLRSSAVFGVGLYGGISFGRYDDFEEGIAFDPVYRDRFGAVADDAFHTTVSVGVRFTLFP